LARPAGKIICNKCNTIGFISKRPANVPVQVPRNPHINTILEAWDYAAKVCLRHRDMMILFPPTLPADDEALSQINYQYFSKFTLHTNEEIKAFESRHLSSPDKNIKTMKARLTSHLKRTTEDHDYINPVNKLPETDTIHIQLPDDSGRITKSSISCLYASIVCKVIGDTSNGIPSIAPEYNKNCANAIHSIFRLLLDDLRYSNTTIEWFLKILPDVYDHGYTAAASKNAISIQDNMKVRLSSKHVRNKSEKLSQMIVDMENSRVLDYFECFMRGFEFIMKNNPDLKEDFQKRFHNYEIEAVKGDFLTKYYYFVGHSVDSDDGSDNKHNRSKKKWCPIKKHDLAYIKIKDEGYSTYENLINDIAKALCEGNRESGTIHASARNMLHQLGWTEKFIEDKMHADIEQVFAKYMNELESKAQSYYDSGVKPSHHNHNN
jgi:hypothetical protein